MHGRRMVLDRGGHAGHLVRATRVLQHEGLALARLRRRRGGGRWGGGEGGRRVRSGAGGEGAVVLGHGVFGTGSKVWTHGGCMAPRRRDAALGSPRDRWRVLGGGSGGVGGFEPLPRTGCTLSLKRA